MVNANSSVVKRVEVEEKVSAELSSPFDILRLVFLGMGTNGADRRMVVRSAKVGEFKNQAS